MELVRERVDAALLAGDPVFRAIAYAGSKAIALLARFAAQPAPSAVACVASRVHADPIALFESCLAGQSALGGTVADLS